MLLKQAVTLVSIIAGIVYADVEWVRVTGHSTDPVPPSKAVIKSDNLEAFKKVLEKTYEISGTTLYSPVKQKIKGGF